MAARVHHHLATLVEALLLVLYILQQTQFIVLQVNYYLATLLVEALMLVLLYIIQQTLFIVLQVNYYLSTLLVEALLLMLYL